MVKEPTRRPIFLPANMTSSLSKWPSSVVFFFLRAYQLLAHGRWFSPGTPASSTTKTCHHDIAEILLQLALNTKIQVHSFHIARRWCIFTKTGNFSLTKKHLADKALKAMYEVLKIGRM
jgi:hypothetical protein